MDIQGAVLQLLVAAVPAIILYFTGWSYLYFYLDSFQINISEVNFDPTTIFIYAYPPLHTLWKFHSTIIVVLIAFAAVLLIVGGDAWRWTDGLPRRAQILVGEELVRYFARRAQTVSPVAWTIGLLFVIIFVLPLPLARLGAWAAAYASDQVWEGRTVELNPLLKDEVAPATTAAVSSTEDDRAALLANYAACMKAGELGLIFSVEAHYYLLCRAADAQDVGNVFEVSAKEGLISVRSIYRIRE